MTIFAPEGLLEGLLMAASVNDIRNIVYRSELALTSNARVDTLCRAFQAAMAREEGASLSLHQRNLALILLEELLAGPLERCASLLSCIEQFMHTLMSKDADLECFTMLMRYAARQESSPTIRAIICWGLCTLPGPLHSSIWAAVIEDLAQLCAACPLLLIWYWLLHCYEINPTLGASFLEKLHDLAVAGTITMCEYNLLKALTYLSIVTESRSFLLNKHNLIRNIEKVALFPSDILFFSCISSTDVLNTLASYPGGLEACVAFLRDARYCQQPAVLSAWLSPKPNRENLSNVTADVSAMLISSLFALVRHLFQLHMFPFSRPIMADIYESVQRSVFPPEYIRSICLVLKERGVYSCDYDFSRVELLNDLHADLCSKKRWAALDCVTQQRYLAKILLLLASQEKEWSILKPWVDLATYIAGKLMGASFVLQKTLSADMSEWAALLDCLGAVHPALPIACVARAVSNTSKNTSAFSVRGFQALLTRGWISRCMRTDAFAYCSQSSKSGKGERKFVTEAICHLLIPICSHEPSAFDTGLQWHKLLVIPGMLQAALIQVPWIGTNKAIMHLLKVALSNSWISVEQWDEMIKAAHNSYRSEASFVTLDEVALLELNSTIELFVLDKLLHDSQEKRIDNLIGSLVHWYAQSVEKMQKPGSGANQQGKLSESVANTIKKYMVRLESPESKADMCFKTLCSVDRLNDIALAIFDVISGLESQLEASARDRLAITLERYGSGEHS